LRGDTGPTPYFAAFPLALAPQARNDLASVNVVFLSPHFPPNWWHFCRGLRQAGATVLGLGDAPYEWLSPELRDTLTEYFKVNDMHNYDELLRAIGHFTHRHGKIDRLDSLNEYWLETEARLRTDFNIPGIDQRAIARMKRKSLMKGRFERAGLRVPRGRVCRSPRVARRFVAEVGYPVVAKPDAGVGAARTYKLENEADLDRYLRDKLPVDYILEECITGTLLTYDGLVDRFGDVIFDSSLVYSIGVMESVNESLDLYYWIGREIPADVIDAGRAVVRAFTLRERPFHFEFFRVPDGSLVPLEVNMRPPGGLTVDMWNFGNEFDFYREWANVLVHGTSEAKPSRPYCVVYASRRDGHGYHLAHDEVIRRFAPLIVHYQRMESIFSGAIGDYGYIMRGPTLDPLIAVARAIQEPPESEQIAKEPVA
jgi:hypothetical protein